MDLSLLTKFELYDHLVNINDAFLKVCERNKGEVFLESDEVEAVRKQLAEVLDELQRRRDIAALGGSA